MPKETTSRCSPANTTTLCIGVANKDYDAAAIANEVMFRMFERKVVDPG